mmetsp:Transcript_25012/g.28722  ORF Transcript_25012/g.28722 Transcript_25012/m.28722 type:complete len:87 (+) Transcript_25012:2078-2338(+)
MKSLTISNSMQLHDALMDTKDLLFNLRTLKLSKLKSKEIFNLVSSIQHLNYLVLANLDLLKQNFNHKDALFNRYLDRLVIIRCKIA